ncbi:MAG: 7-carboxy-7-deazaguanine synthase QueE [Hyphomicrobiaceae bacterium]|nr:MAG: 7-carboxy-7-deazaguanine synthase QueE [Hyphomicrobiaceae bacterium]
MGDSNTTIKVAEHFLSIQGEGPTAGRRSVFLRLQGCNLMCGGQATVFDKQLHDGATWRCDTIEVWMKGKRYSVEGLLELFKQQGYLQALREGAHLIITGGEPLIQQDAAAEFLERLYFTLEKHSYVEVETNGTIIPSDTFSARISQWNVSPKLKNSGMSVDKRIKLQALDWFAADPRAFFKFVVADLADVNEVEGAFLASYPIVKERVFLMPAASDRDTLRSREDAVSMYALALGVNYSSRLQVQIWNMTTGV